VLHRPATNIKVHGADLATLSAHIAGKVAPLPEPAEPNEVLIAVLDEADEAVAALFEEALQPEPPSPTPASRFAS
jgi:hypothetical protein